MSALCMFGVLASSMSAKSRARPFRPFLWDRVLTVLGFLIHSINCVVSCFLTLFSLFELAPSRQNLFRYVTPPFFFFFEAPRPFAVSG